MSHEQLTHPTPVVRGLTLTTITSGIMTVFNNAVAALNISDNLDLNETNTLNIINNPTFGIIQDTNLTQIGTNNVGMGSGALDAIINNTNANTAIGSFALLSLDIGNINSALGYGSGLNLQYNPGIAGSPYGNTFLGSGAGVDFNTVSNYGQLGIYAGVFSAPSANNVSGETAIGVYRQGLGSGTTTIGNGQVDLGTLTTNAGLERFVFNAAYTPNTTYEPVHFSTTFNIGNITPNFTTYTFRVDQPGIYRFTLQVTQQSNVSHVWSVYRTDNPGVNVTGTVVSLTSPDQHLATDLYFISDSTQQFYIMSDYGNHAAVTVSINLTVEFVSLYVN